MSESYNNANHSSSSIHIRLSLDDNQFSALDVGSDIDETESRESLDIYNTNTNVNANANTSSNHHSIRDLHNPNSTPISVDQPGGTLAPSYSDDLTLQLTQPTDADNKSLQAYRSSALNNAPHSQNLSTKSSSSNPYNDVKHSSPSKHTTFSTSGNVETCIEYISSNHDPERILSNSTNLAADKNDNRNDRKRLYGVGSSLGTHSSFKNVRDKLRQRKQKLKSKITRKRAQGSPSSIHDESIEMDDLDFSKNTSNSGGGGGGGGSIHHNKHSFNHNEDDENNSIHHLHDFHDFEPAETPKGFGSYILNSKLFNFFKKKSPGDADTEYTPIFEDSRYPEVRASVPNTDNFELPQNTLRMWVIGLVLTTVGNILNTIFSLHTPTFVISTFVASMIAWPLGRFWERVVPNKTILGIALNPSPFNLKEHALIAIMASISFGDGTAYMTNIVLTLRHFYEIDFGWGFNIIGSICTQVIGYSMAGIARRILVYPASMIWPSTLVTSTFLTNIHLNVNHVTHGWRITRLKLFFIVMTGCFIWSWIPGFFAPFLSQFCFLTWITPNNIVINQLFGSSTGLGMLPITFDWNQIAGYLGSPLIPPFFALGNIIAAIFIVFWIVTPIIHYSNVWYGHYLPISSVDTFDRFQNSYNVSRILTKRSVFDLNKYENYSPIFMSATFAVSYGMSFASISATIMHTFLFHGKEILFFWKHSRKDPDDIHMHLMKRYKEAPDWWYWISLIIFLGMSIMLVRVWDTDMPVWALFFALAIASAMIVPVGMIYALTNISVGLNVVTELIVGYLVPGRPVAMMLFKTFGYITNFQAIRFLEGIKLGHYTKISPRLLFFVQLTATVWGGVVQLGALYWAENNIIGICSPTQSASFSCSSGRVFFNASVIWGVIGPQRQFSVNQIYNKTFYFFLVGGLLPLATWLFLKKYPKSPVRHIHWPVFFTGTGYIPPATPFNYGVYCAVGYVFGYLIKRRYFGWWAKYNYTLSAGLDLGLAWASLIMFIVTLSPKVHAPSWWGTMITKSTADYKGVPMIQLKEGQAFGPEKW